MPRSQCVGAYLCVCFVEIWLSCKWKTKAGKLSARVNDCCCCRRMDTSASLGGNQLKFRQNIIINTNRFCRLLKSRMNTFLLQAKSLLR